MAKILENAPHVARTFALAATVVVGLLAMGMSSANAQAAPENTIPPALSGSQSSSGMSVADLIKSMKADLLEAQKQAYERELELKKLRSQLQNPPAQSSDTTPKDPWVQVNVSGTTDNSTAVQPAVTTPESLKTSIQYYKHQYILKPGDKLAINFIGEDPNRVTSKETTGDDISKDFLQKVTVLTDGTIVLPPFGLMNVAGKTLKQINDELNEAIHKYYRFATINVSLSEAAPDDILILGAVKKQGYAKVPVGTTISQLFKQADGVDSRADLSHVFIRKKDNGNVYMADMMAFLEKGDIGQDMILQTGDVVVVPEGQTDISYERLANSTFLPNEFEVKVLGAVSKADAVKVKPGDDVASALAKAGGVLQHANSSKISLIRHDRSTNALKVITLNLKQLSNPKTSSQVNVALMPDDLIVVEDSRWKRAMFNMATQAGVNAFSFFWSQALFQTFFSKK